jgi:hypothetical protein
MAKSLKKAEPKIELRLDGWDRFKTAVGAAAKSGPKHRSVSKSNQPKKKPGRPAVK